MNALQICETTSSATTTHLSGDSPGCTHITPSIRDGLRLTRRQAHGDDQHGRRWHRIIEYQRVTVKEIARSVLAACPGTNPEQLGKGLYFPGEVACENFHNPQGVGLLVSAHNPGVQAIATELAAVFPWITSCVTAMESGGELGMLDGAARGGGLPGAGTALEDPSGLLLTIDHPIKEVLSQLHAVTSKAIFFLLYLNNDTFLGIDGKYLADQIRSVKNALGVVILMVHENDKKLGGCEFGRLFSTTPEDLIKDDLYSEIALAFHEQPHRQVSWALAGRKMGAVPKTWKIEHYFNGFLGRFSECFSKPSSKINASEKRPSLSASLVALVSAPSSKMNASSSNTNLSAA